MKHTKLALGLALILSVFIFTGCPGPNVSTDPDITVTFIDNGETLKTVDIASGTVLQASKIPANPNKVFNRFLYWSESTASQAAAVEFDFTKPITKNTTLYAIFAPSLYSIETFNSKSIQIKFYSPNVYPLDDGSYAGLKFQYSKDNGAYTDVDLKIPSSTDDINTYRYVTYNFKTRLEGGHYTFKVTNSVQTETLSKDIISNARTVDFYNCGNLLKSVDVSSGQALSSSDIPTNPTVRYNYFMYWSKSKASKATATQFDLNTPITQDTQLYAIYTPQLYGIKSIAYNTITITLYDDTVYPLDDGSYAGIIIEHSTDGTNYETCNVNDIPAFEDSSSFRYLTYTFTNPLTSGKHYFKISNAYGESYSKSESIYEPAPVTNLNAETADSYANITFTTVEGWKNYTVKAYLNSNEIASKTVTASTTSSSKYAEFFGLQNNSEYTFKVFTVGSDKSAQINATPTITKKDTDWLMLMYMDGDNNLHDQIFLDMNEVEYGLSQIQNSSGDPKENFDKVNVVALWDGAVSWEGTDQNGNPATVTPQIGPSGTYLYEMGIQSSWDSNYALNGPSCNLNYNTKNLSYTANWLVSQVTNTYDVHGEADMGNKQTLINFLNWATARYNVDKGIILQFSDHGGGPRSVRYVQTKDGRTIKIGDTSGRRALCWDESSNSNFLKTKDVSEALAQTGFVGDNKLAMILMDVCLGSSIEDAYQFKDYAQYLAASPNTIPGAGLDYKTLFTAFTTSATLDSIGKHIVTEYKTQYTTGVYNNYAFWDAVLQQYDFGVDLNSLTPEEQETAITSALNELIWYSELGITTFTITDLSKINDVKTAIDSMCNIMSSDPTKAEDFKKCVNFFSGMYYMGTYTWLYDIGYTADMIAYLSGDTIKNEQGEDVDNTNKWPELKAAAEDVITSLGQAIKYSWRDSPSTNKDFYSDLDKSSAENFKHYYGLTIAGAYIATNGENLIQGTAPSWYKTDLAFGADSAWGDLLEYWFGTGN
ncbi:MAG: hypothetical protein J5726_03945 [Treponema sp.]|nr:hypothetical protein [Treponema sp.]